MGAELVHATIRAVSPGPVHIVSLTLEDPGLNFRAGQYVHVLHPSGARIPFSIASPPQRMPDLEIHFQPTPGHPDSARMQELLAGTVLLLDGVAGTTVLESTNRTDLLFVCAGSGFAQAAAMVDDALSGTSRRHISVLWCCEDRTGFYAPERWYGFGHSVSRHLCIDPSRDAGNAASKWIKKRSASIARGTGVFLCGSPGFVHAMTDALIAGGVSAKDLHSDVYAWAPRNLST